jgi:biopolymer transport protein ExbD
MAGGASSGTYEDEGVTISEINVTPLVDVVLVLLIVFMITMPTIVAIDALNEREIELSLPYASEATPLVVQPEALIVNVDHNGRYYVEGQAASPGEVEDLLRQAAANNPASQTVILRADKRVEVDYVVFVLNMCAKLGIAGCQLTTEGAEM